MPLPRDLWDPTGPAVARLFHALLAGIYGIAWLTLGSQVRVLMGARGLAPLGELPILGTLSDDTLVAGCGVGVALALLGLLGLQPRAMVLFNAALYLAYVLGCGSFLAFQWDNLLIEAGVLASLLPRDRRAPWIHFLLRCLLFKVFFESAIAKAQSPIGDWWDGTAMSYYYETAPIPTWLAWYAHHLPAAWHRFESWWTLFFEGVLCFGIFGPRLLRRVALAAFAGFLVLDAATANYGFFVHITAALCVFLLEESQVAAALSRLPWARAVSPIPPPPTWPRQVAAALLSSAWLSLSVAAAVGRFSEHQPLAGAVEATAPLRIANVYHLFSQITRTRVEPEFQTWDGRTWTAHDLWYKPGDPKRAPPFVAPHQPRVDFRLWFFGLGFRRGAPGYVQLLLARLCLDPAAVQPLFPDPLPDAPVAVRIVFWDTHFTTPAERAASGAWWSRQELGHTRELPCRSGAGVANDDDVH